MAGDKYRDFRHLAQNEVEGTDFRVRTRASGTTLILAPHGGGIEPGTSELAEAVAGADHSLYLFEGIKAGQNGDLHVTSTVFDEPRCNAMLQRAEGVVAVHGAGSPETAVYIGGLDTGRLNQMRAALATGGFDVRSVARPQLAGTAPKNVCNRGCTGAGVQIEIAEGLRRTFFRRLSPRAERQHRTDAFNRFVFAIRQGLRAPE